MTSTGSKIARRKPIFFGCEGESEVGYAQTLGDIFDEQNLSIHLDAVLLSPGAGSPSSKIVMATKKIAEHERKRSQYWKKIILLDTDRLENDQNERDRTNSLALENNIFIVWQRPSHEAFLLRHLQGCAQLRPATIAQATSLLVDKWPNYRKPMNRMQVAKSINSVGVRQAAAVEPELRTILNEIGWR